MHASSRSRQATNPADVTSLWIRRARAREVAWLALRSNSFPPLPCNAGRAFAAAGPGALAQRRGRCFVAVRTRRRGTVLARRLCGRFRRRRRCRRRRRSCGRQRVARGVVRARLLRRPVRRSRSLDYPCRREGAKTRRRGAASWPTTPAAPASGPAPTARAAAPRRWRRAPPATRRASESAPRRASAARADSPRGPRAAPGLQVLRRVRVLRLVLPEQR